MSEFEHPDAPGTAGTAPVSRPGGVGRRGFLAGAAAVAASQSRATSARNPSPDGDDSSSSSSPRSP